MCFSLTACSQAGKADYFELLEAIIAQQASSENDNGDVSAQTISIGANVVPLKQLKKETLIADYLLNTHYQDDADLQLSLIHQRNKTVLAQYINQTVVNAISDNEIDAFYQNNKELWQQVKAEVARIVFVFNDRMPTSKKQTVLKRAETVKSDLLNQTLSFEDALETYSERSSLIRTPGNMDIINLKSFDQSTQEKLLALKPGEFIGPVQTPQGFEIIQLKSEFDITLMPLAMVKDSVYKALLQEKTHSALAVIIKQAGVE